MARIDPSIVAGVRSLLKTPQSFAALEGFFCDLNSGEVNQAVSDLIHAGHIVYDGVFGVYKAFTEPTTPSGEQNSDGTALISGGYPENHPHLAIDPAADPASERNIPKEFFDPKWTDRVALSLERLADRLDNLGDKIEEFFLTAGGEPSHSPDTPAPEKSGAGVTAS